MILKKINKIYELALHINNYVEGNDISTKGPTVFIKFSGHVNLFEILVYKDGLRKSGRATYRNACYLEQPTAEESLDNMIQYLEGLMYESRCK